MSTLSLHGSQPKSTFGPKTRSTLGKYSTLFISLIFSTGVTPVYQLGFSPEVHLLVDEGDCALNTLGRAPENNEDCISPPPTCAFK